MEKFSEYSQLPMSSLSSSARRTLSLYLNVLNEIPSRHNVPNDIRGVADLRGFLNLHTQNFLRSSDPTAALLHSWNSYGLSARGTSVKTLLDILDKLDRRDILKALEPGLKLSLENHQHHMAYNAKLSEQTTQVAVVSSSEAPFQDPEVDENRYLSIHDTEEEEAIFDVFVSSTGKGKDLEFTKMLIDTLENKYDLKCYLNERDGLAAGTTHVTHAKLIQRRCRKFVVIISHEFVKSPACDFQVRFAHCLSPGAHAKKIIPILIEKNVRGPEILFPISALDWTREDLRCYFWERLVKTIRKKVNVPDGHKPELDTLSLVSDAEEVWVDDSPTNKLVK